MSENESCYLDHDWEISAGGCGCGDDNCLVVCATCGAQDRACEWSE